MGSFQVVSLVKTSASSAVLSRTWSKASLAHGRQRPVRTSASTKKQTKLLQKAQKQVSACSTHGASLMPIPNRRLALVGLIVTAANIPSAEGQTAAASELPQVKKVFVAGSTGNTGSRVVRLLRARGVPVIAGVRSTEKVLALGFDIDPGIEVVKADVTEGVGPLESALRDADAVICALGYNGGSDPQGFIEVDSKGTINLIQAAQAKGITTFVLESSVLTGADRLGLMGKVMYAALNYGTNALDRKKEAEAYLKQASTQSGLRYTIVRPAALTNDPPNKVGVPVFTAEDKTLGGRSVSRDSVAELMIEALFQPAATNKTVEIASAKNGVVLPPEQWFP